MSHARHNHAFTILELLVVLSIIVLLIGLLLPALARGRAVAQRTVCMAQLREIGIAMAQYMHRNRGNVPEVQTLPVDKYAPSLVTELHEFLVNDKIWHCPSDKELFNEVGTSYEYFIGFYLTVIDLQRANKDLKKNQLLQFFRQMPSMAFIVNDAEDFHAFGPNGVGRNSLFLDGHVDWFALPKQDASGGGGSGAGAGGSSGKS